MWQRHAWNMSEVSRRRCRNVSGTCFKPFEEDATTYQEHLASYSKTRWHTYQEGRAIYLQVGRCCNVSGMYCKLLDEDVAKYQEHHSRDLKKMWQRHAWNMSEVSRRRCHNASGTCFKSFQEDATTYQEHLASYCKTRWRTYQEGRAIYLQVGRCCNVAGMYCKLLDEDVAT